jgi:hypothetical protein
LSFTTSIDKIERSVRDDRPDVRKASAPDGTVTIAFSDIAARISALALGGELLASDLGHALASGLGTFTFGAPRTATLKGHDGSFSVHPVLG